MYKVIRKVKNKAKQIIGHYRLELNLLRLIPISNASSANNPDFSLRLELTVLLTDQGGRANIISHAS